MINKQTTLDLNGPILSFIQQPSSVTLNSGESATFSGIATATYPTQDPVNPATNTGSISYQWYVDGYGALVDGSIPVLGLTVVGSATTTLSVSNVTTPTSNNKRFYLVADVIPSAYSQPTGSAVIAGTARSTGNASNRPKSSDTAILTVNPIISVISNPSDQEVSEGVLATFTASGSSSDETAVSFRWQLNGSFLVDNGTTIIGSNTNTLQISLTGGSSNTVRAEISHPTASNSPVYTSSANFNVLVTRSVINFEKFNEGSTRITTGSFDLTQVANFELNSFNEDDQSVVIYAPEKDIKVRISLAGAAGRSRTTRGGGNGGNGGYTVFEIILRKNVEYVFKLGSEYNTGGTPSGGYNNGGGLSAFYRQSEVLVVSGGGGGSGIYADGGNGGGAEQSGSNGKLARTITGQIPSRAAPGAGGQLAPVGSLGLDGSTMRRVDGKFTDEITQDRTF